MSAARNELSQKVWNEGLIGKATYADVVSPRHDGWTRSFSNNVVDPRAGCRFQSRRSQGSTDVIVRVLLVSRPFFACVAGIVPFFAR